MTLGKGPLPRSLSEGEGGQTLCFFSGFALTHQRNKLLGNIHC